MANLGGLLGTAGGANGTGFAGPTTGNIVSPSELNASTNNAQAALAQQQALVQALQAQNGIVNQGNVYKQLQGIAAGTGPNPAQTMLNKATGANTANTAALLASSRGSSANPAAIARTAAQIGAQNQQQAASDAATIQAQQALQAIQQASGIAGTQVQNQIGATQGNVQGTQNQEMGLLNAATGLQSNVNNANAGLVGATMGQQASIGSSMSKGIGSAIGMGAEGGKVKMVDGGMAFQYTPQAPAINTDGPLSSVGQYFANIANMGDKGTSPSNVQKSAPTTTGEAAPWGLGGGMAGGPGDTMSNTFSQPTELVAAKGGKVPVMLSKGEKVVSPKDVKAVAAGKKDPLKQPTVPGTPKHPGNDYRNDIVPADLEEGSIVIPNKVLQGKSPHWAAMRFVQAHMAAGGKVGMIKRGLSSKPKKAK